MDPPISSRSLSRIDERSKVFAENHLHLQNVVAARTGKAVRELSQIFGFTNAVTVLWRPHYNYTQVIELSDHDDCILPRLRLSSDRADWHQLRILQILMVTDSAAVKNQLMPSGRTHS